MQNKKTVIVSVVVLLALFIGGVFFYKQNEAKKLEQLSKEQAQLFQRDYSVVIGPKDAKVQLVEFFDPACETCAHYHFYVKDIMKKYEGDIKLVLRYAPFHQNSNYAVKMLEGAREQGLFDETLEFMFRTQQHWIDHHVVNPRKLWSILPNIKDLDMQKLADSMNSEEADRRIMQDLADIKALEQTKTPAFFVNGKPLQTFGLDPLIELIESEL